MDPDIKNLLEANLKLSKENNKLLLKIRSVQFWGQVTRVFYWFLIIGISVGAFYFIKPYVGNILNLYSGGVSGLDNIGDMTETLKNSNEIQDLLKQLSE